MDAQAETGSPRMRALNLRREAADKAVEAAKVFNRVAHLEAVSARLLLKRVRLYANTVRLMARGQHYYSRMKDHVQDARQGGEIGSTLESEIVRKKDKASKLVMQAEVEEKKRFKTEEKIEALLKEAEDLKKERDSYMIESKKLEAEAVRVESMF